MKKIIGSFFAFLALNTHATQYQAIELVSGLTIPWAIEFIDPDRLIINQKNGDIALFTLSSNKLEPLFSVPNLYKNGQAGLLDVALLPSQNSNNSSLFFTYSIKTEQGNSLALARATLKNNQLKDWKTLFIADAFSSKSIHFGSRIALVDDKVFFSIGDRGVRSHGQNLNTHAGAILRLNIDGSIPEDNPFKEQGVKAEIWSYGHRNPQGLFYDKATQSLWSIEHGPRGGDEINLIKKGSNYGWAKASYGKEYWGPFAAAKTTSFAGMTEPKLIYTPSIAPSNMLLYRGERYPDLKGKILAAALKLTHINVVSIEKGKLSESFRLLAELNERIRDISVSPDDYLYFSTDSGKIYRLEPRTKNH